jgi:hypothetical protein
MIELLEFAPDDLSGDLASRIHALLSNVWPEDAPNDGDYYRTHGPPTTVMILREVPDVLAHLAVYERQVLIGSETLEIGMLGGIVVASEHRRKGHSILFACEPRLYASSGYKLMENPARIIDTDGTLKTLVDHGGMYAELSQRRWPNQMLDLRGRVV